MPLDIAPFELWHAWGALLVFAVTFAGIRLLVHNLPYSLRACSTARPVVYAGWLLAIIVMAAGSLAVPSAMHAVGLAAATAVLVVAGRADERMPQQPRNQLVWQVVIAALAVLFGWTVPYVSHPFAEGVLHLDQLLVGVIVFPGAVIAVAILVLFMNAINWLDGIDGLAPAVSFIALMMLALVALLPSIQDGTTLALALIGAAGVLALAIWNAPPAKVYLGTSGAWFLGLYIGLVAIQGGGKVATALVIFAIPVLDAIAVIVRRIIRGRRPWQGDRVSHIQHRLRALGISDWNIVGAASAATVALGLVGIFAPTPVKLAVLGLVTVVYVGTGIVYALRVNVR